MDLAILFGLIGVCIVLGTAIFLGGSIWSSSSKALNLVVDGHDPTSYA